MVIVTSRDFRANQSMYFEIAKNQDVIVTCRNKGSFRIVPVKEDDTLISKEELYAKIEKGIAEHEMNPGLSMGEHESGEEFINRILCNTK